MLTLPVDGSAHILSYEMGNAIVERLKPKIVIPTHYLNEITRCTLTTLQTADKWVKSQKSYKMLDGPALDLDAARSRAWTANAFISATTRRRPERKRGADGPLRLRDGGRSHQRARGPRSYRAH